MASNASARSEQSSQASVCDSPSRNTHAADDNASVAHLRECHEALNGIDSMCQIQLGQIDALITSMLHAMETPAYWLRPLVIRESLGLMKYLADDLMNFVNSSAEGVGCNSVDEFDRARETRVLAAFREAAAAEANRLSLAHARAACEQIAHTEARHG